MEEETSLAAEELNLLAKLIGANQTNMKVEKKKNLVIKFFYLYSNNFYLRFYYK